MIRPTETPDTDDRYVVHVNGVEMCTAPEMTATAFYLLALDAYPDCTVTIGKKDA